jgi:hypothetical protein
MEIPEFETSKGSFQGDWVDEKRWTIFVIFKCKDKPNIK